MNAPNLARLRPEQRARFLAIEAAGFSQPGTRLLMETLDFPRSCRARACRRAKACVADKLHCARDNRELMRNEVLPAMLGERPR